MVRLLIVSFPILLAIDSIAQESNIPKLKVESSEVVEGAFFDCRDIDNIDVNGDCLAGLIVESNLSNLVFNPSNGFMPAKPPVREGSNYRLYISKSERVIEVSAEGFLKDEIVLSSYGVTLEEGQFWKLVITGDVNQNVPVTIFVLNNGNRLSEYDLIIDGELVLDSDESHDYDSVIELDEGSHDIQIRKDGFETISEKITVDRTRTLYSFELERVDPIILSINTQPGEVDVLVEDVSVGITDNRGNLQLFQLPGDYRFSFFKSGFLRYDTTLTISPNSRPSISASLTKSAGTLSFDVFPSGATIKVNNVTMGSTEIELPPGTHRVEIDKNGYESFVDDVILRIGETKELTVSLTPITGSLQFRVEPYDALVKLYDQDNMLVEEWEGLKLVNDLIVGEYRAIITSDGYLIKQETIQINKDNITDVDVSLALAPLTSPVNDSKTIENAGKEINSNKYFVIGVGLILRAPKNSAFIKNFLPGVGFDGFVTRVNKISNNADVWAKISGSYSIYSEKDSLLTGLNGKSLEHYDLNLITGASLLIDDSKITAGVGLQTGTFVLGEESQYLNMIIYELGLEIRSFQFTFLSSIKSDPVGQEQNIFAIRYKYRF